MTEDSKTILELTRACLKKHFPRLYFTDSEIWELANLPLACRPERFKKLESDNLNALLDEYMTIGREETP